MFSRHHRKARLLFGLSDVVITAVAFEAAYLTRAWLPIERDFFLTVPLKALLLGLAMVTWILIGHWLDVYDRLDAAHPNVVVRESFRQCLFGSICLVLMEYLFRLDLSRGFLLLFASYSWVGLCLFRWKAGSLVGLIRREYSGPHYVMIVGLGESARRMGEMLETSEKYGIRLRGFLAVDADHPPALRLSKQHPVYPLSSLMDMLQKNVIDEIIFAVDVKRLPELEEVFLMCDEEGVRTHLAVNFFPHVNSEVYLDKLGPASLLTFAAAPHDELLLFLKRVTDFVLAVVFLVVLLPLMIVIGLLVKVSSPGPIIFRQVRCGLNGRKFMCYKFRSMCDAAEQMKAQYQHLNEKQTAFKISNDPRLTLLGRYMRKFSIDEWPQLWNVIKGEMSLVGPRPAIPEEVQRYQRWQRRRLRMRPGLTCLWAVSGRDRLDFDTWMKLDMQYIDRWSLSLDWKIILRTIPQVLFGKGAY